MIMRNLTGLLLLILTALVGPGTLAAQEAAVSQDGTPRRALFICADEYDTADQLKNLPSGMIGFADLVTPCSDSADIKKHLLTIGWKESDFQVLPDNASASEIYQALRDFQIWAKSHTGSFGLVYVATHGVQIRDRIYIIPARTHIDFSQVDHQSFANWLASEDTPIFSDRLVDIDSAFLDDFGTACNQCEILIVLDACRKSPLRNIVAMERQFRSLSKADDLPISLGLPHRLTQKQGIGVFYPTTLNSAVTEEPEGSVAARGIMAESKRGITVRKTANALFAYIQDKTRLEVRQSPEFVYVEQRDLLFAPIATTSLSSNLKLSFRRAARAISDQVALANEANGQIHRVSYVQQSLAPQKGSSVPTSPASRAVSTVQERPSVYSRTDATRDNSMFIDVLWCGGPSGKARRQAAEKFAKALLPLAEAQELVEGKPIGRIRLGEFGLQKNANSSFFLDANVVRVQVDDFAEKGWGDRINGVDGVALGVQTITSTSKSLITVFFCEGAAADIAALNIQAQSLVYVHASREDQRAITDRLSKNYNSSRGPIFISSVQVVQKSPDTPEIRIYHPEDQKTANELADFLAPLLTQRPIVKLLSPPSGSSPTFGTIEVWLGRTGTPLTATARCIYSIEDEDKCHDEAVFTAPAGLQFNPTSLKGGGMAGGGSDFVCRTRWLGANGDEDNSAPVKLKLTVTGGARTAQARLIGWAGCEYSATLLVKRPGT